jgi:TRAP-type C4-dicarboxylate transport system permease small subunit
MSGMGSIWAQTYKVLNRCLVPIENAAAVISGLLTLLAMILTTADALMRYAFNAPLVFQFYFTSNYVLVGLVLMALPWGFRTGGYIRIALVTENLPIWLRNSLLRAGLAISAGYIALLAWTSGQYFLKAYATNQTYIEEVNWPVAWSWVWIPVGCGLLVLRVLLTATGPAEELHIEHDPEEDL